LVRLLKFAVSLALSSYTNSLIAYIIVSIDVLKYDRLLTSRCDSAQRSIMYVELQRTFMSRSSLRAFSLCRVWMMLKSSLCCEDECAYSDIRISITTGQRSYQSLPLRKWLVQALFHPCSWLLYQACVCLQCVDCSILSCFELISKLV